MLAGATAWLSQALLLYVCFLIKFSRRLMLSVFGVRISVSSLPDRFTWITGG